MKNPRMVVKRFHTGEIPEVKELATRLSKHERIRKQAEDIKKNRLNTRGPRFEFLCTNSGKSKALTRKKMPT